MVNWQGVHLPWVHVHSAIYETYWVYQYCMDLWLIGKGSICHGYMCILLYVRLMGCNGFAWIYGQLAEESICHGYMCILLYMKLIGCNGFACIYGPLAEGSICHGYMCILLYMRLIGFNGFAWIYCQLAGVHLPWVDVHSAICETYVV